MIPAEALWLILPAYIANSSAVIMGGGTPIDFGKTWNDKRIFGDGKTWRGLLGGTAAGMATGFLIDIVSPSTYGKYPVSLFIIFSLSWGALLGDLAFSFIKRQKGKKRGEKWIPFDQLDFIMGAFVFTYVTCIVIEKVGGSSQNWFSSSFSVWHIIFLIIFTPFIHYIANVIGHSIKLKKVPW
jgi:CDP-2,3-bis-(O-geranylgeranyl)-sn-glycerol synthase